MPPTKRVRYPIKFKRNETWTRDLFFHDNTADKVPVDLTGRSFYSQIRQAYSGALISQITFTLYDQTVDGERGKGWVAMSLSPTDTRAINPGNYLYDAFQKLVDGTIEPLFEGDVTVEDSVTVIS